MRTVEIDRSTLQSLLVLASVIEARDPFTAGHVWRTSRYARLLAVELGLDGGDVFLCQLGGLVHDLGKVGIPDALLHKRERFTAAEYEVVKLHPEIGHEIVRNHPLSPLVELPVLQHHLRVDGTGYPSRLATTEPSIVARVVAVADTFDAITSFRPYRADNVVDLATGELAAARGRQLDAACVDAFVTLWRRGALEHVLGHAREGALLVSCPECGPIVSPPAAASDGDAVVCPACTGEFVLHFDRGSFALEWKGTRAGFAVPRPDLEAVAEVLRDAPPRVTVE